MRHGRHHSRKRAVLGMLAAISLAGCAEGQLQHLVGLQPGQLIDRPPPPVTVVRDGPTGELIAGPAAILVPDAAVDLAVAEPLRPWLTAIERRRLAEASQHAADDYVLQPTPWEATDPTGIRTAAGEAVPVDNAFRAVRGQICRDVRQSMVKSDAAQEQQVTLCRRDFGNGLFVWVVGDGNQ